MTLRQFALPAKIALTLALGGLLLRHVDIAEMAGLLRKLGAGGLLLAAALMGLQAVMLAWRWHLLLRLLGQRLPGPLAFRWVMVGLFFNQALPSSVGGDVFRVWSLQRRGAAPGTAFASVALERLTGVTLLALMVAACVPLLGPGLPASAAWVLMLTGPALAAGLALLTLADRVALLRWLPAGLRPSLTATSGGLRKVLASPPDALAVAALGLAASLSGLCAAWVLGRSLGIDQPLSAVIVVLGGAMLISVLPISLGGWGVREASVVALFGALGLAPERALALALAFGLLQLMTSLPGGVLWWLDGRGAPSRPALPGAAAPPAP